METAENHLGFAPIEPTPRRQFLEKIIAGAIGIGAGIAIDRFAIPFAQQQIAAIRDPDVSGRVINELEMFVSDAGNDRRFVREYQILTGSGQEVWANDAYPENPGGYKTDSDWPAHIFKVGQDVRLKFSGQYPHKPNEWVNSKESGKPTDVVYPIMAIAEHEVVKPVPEAPPRHYSDISGMVIEGSIRRHDGESEKVWLEEYTIMTSNGERWYVAKKHPISQDGNESTRPQPLLKVGTMASVYRAVDFRLEGEEYRKNEGKDEWGTESSKIVWGIDSVNSIPYANASNRIPPPVRREQENKNEIKELLPQSPLPFQQSRCSGNLLPVAASLWLFPNLQVLKSRLT